jgi:hypothetical protein
MKSKEEIQRTWDTAWFTPLAESELLTFEQQVPIKVELRKEVFWVVTLSPDVDLVLTLIQRSNKISALMAAHDGSASSFDPYYQYRQQFFDWAAL